jgi:hypothetical protein
VVSIGIYLGLMILKCPYEAESIQSQAFSIQEAFTLVGSISDKFRNRFHWLDVEQIFNILYIPSFQIKN